MRVSPRLASGDVGSGLVSQDLTALVDLGSNSARFMLVRIVPGVGYRVLRDERAQTRLGSGRDGTLPAEAVTCTIDAVERFLGVVSPAPYRVLAVATAAVRDAPNAGDLLESLRLEAGIEVEVLSADEEARLGALAARASLQLRDATVVDVGGCSLQLSAIRDREPAAIASVPLGTLRATQCFLEHDPPTPAELAALRRAVGEAVAQWLPAAQDGEALVGVGGTARALTRLGGSDGRRFASQRMRLRQEELAALCARVAMVNLDDRRQLPGLKPSRADIIVAGAVVLDELLRLGGYQSLLVAEHGVRHGVLLRETFERVRT
jgi:exopolyphosphatase / guanosine-5'-triphosphate,3'-diphosphate pyrophosphatase